MQETTYRRRRLDAYILLVSSAVLQTYSVTVPSGGDMWLHVSGGDPNIAPPLNFIYFHVNYGVG